MVGFFYVPEVQCKVTSELETYWAKVNLYMSIILFIFE